MSRTLMSSARHAAVVVALHVPVAVPAPPLLNPVVVAQLLAKGTNLHTGTGSEKNDSVPQARASHYQGASTKQVADSALTTWRDIDSHLSPIVGAGGVAALYKRSLYLTSKEYPCLRRPLALFQPAEYSLLYLVLLAQERAEAIAVNSALLHTFSRLLAGLIGAPLTERLLLSILDHPSSEPSSLAS